MKNLNITSIIEKIIEENIRLTEEITKLKDSFGYSKVISFAFIQEIIKTEEVFIKTKEELDEYLQKRMSAISDVYAKIKAIEKNNFKLEAFYNSILDKFTRENWSRRKKMRVIARFLDSEFKKDK